MHLGGKYWLTIGKLAQELTDSYYRIKKLLTVTHTCPQPNIARVMP